jgi:hypothetical protein
MANNINLKNLGVQSAKNFRDLLDSANVYLYIGKTAAWDNENNPDVPLNTIEEEISARNSMLYLQKLSKDDSCLCVPKNAWLTGTQYDEYGNVIENLQDTAFYVTTSANRVYKCLDNDNSLSTVAPTGTSTNMLITADGYSWKFMYDVSNTLLIDFTNADYIPVPQDTQKSAAQTNVETSASYTTGDPPKGHGADAASELYATNIMLSATIDLTQFAPDIDHRQFGLIIAPKLDNGTALTGASYLVSAIAFDELSGQVLTISNHYVVDSATDDTEQVQLILKF